MTETQVLLRVWRDSYFDVGKSFDGLLQEHLHTRPHPNALAVSELAAHIAETEALIMLGGILQRPREAWALESVLLNELFDYYTDMLAGPVAPALTTMTPAEIEGEVMRVHGIISDVVGNFDRPADEKFRASWGDEVTVRGLLHYAGYHVGYHVGQIYLTRHLLGETTPGN